MKSFIGVHRCHRWLKNKLPLACVFMLMAVTMAQAVEQERPNIILIVADDLGYGDLSLHGSTVIETPHLDRLGAESMQFRNFSVHPACAPTRASLLTGRHHLRTGVWGVHGGTDFMNLDELTIAEVLKEAGYETGMWGKWHSGKTDGYYPWDRGFDEAYYAQLYRYRDNEGLLNGKPHTLKGWTCERLTDMAIEFIQKERDKPFFAYLPYLTPHGIWDAPPEEIEYYTKKGLSKEFATLAGMISFMDKNIQRLLTAVDDQGLRENTIILFMSDNGPISGHGKKRWITEEEKRQRNAPLNLRGGKGTLWQNGIRSPLFIRWPRVVKPGICDQAATVMDIFPTLAELSQAKLPESGKQLDGQSLAGLLNNPQANWTGSEMFLFRGFQMLDPDITQKKDDGYVRQNLGKRAVGILKDDTKYLEKGGLFNIAADPREKQDLSKAQPEMAEQMTTRSLAVLQEIITDPGSFTRPVFLIGHQGAPTTHIWAYGAALVTSGLDNTNHELKNWQQAGDQAGYDCDIKTPGKYVIWIEETIPGAELTATVNSTSTPVYQAPKDPAQCKSIDLPAGRVRLHISLEETGTKPFALKKISFERVTGK